MIFPLLLLLAQAPVAKPVAAPPIAPFVLKTGEQKKSPVSKATAVNCADPTMVQAVNVDGRFELKGTKVGTTSCSFAEANQKARIVQVTVNP
jgi:hypothetical protein